MAEQIISPGVFANENDQSLYTQGPVVVGAALVGPTVMGTPMVPTVVTSYSDYLAKFGDIFLPSASTIYQEYFTSITAREYFNGGGQSLLVTRIISGSGYDTFATSTVYQLSGSYPYTSSRTSSAFVLETLAWGDQMNNWQSSGSSLAYGTGSGAGTLGTGSSNNVRWEISGLNTGSGTFTLLVRRGDDTTNNKNVLETWSNLSLDPNQPNYIARVIGDTKIVYDNTNNVLQYQGSYPNQSQYIRVKPNSVTNIPNSLDNQGLFKWSQYSGSLPVVGSGSYAVIDGSSAHTGSAQGAFNGGLKATSRTGSYFENVTSTVAECQGFATSDYTASFTMLTNKDEFDFNLLLVPGVTLGTGPLSSISDDAIALCEARTDSMAIIDAVACSAASGSTAQTVTSAVNAAAASTSNYAATYYPWVQVFSSNLGKAVWVPPSVVMAGVYAFNDQVSAEWFAPAGLNRGGIGSVIRAERKLSQSDRDTLYAGNVNPLATFPGNGVVAFGQKTLQKRPTSLDRVNVRRLLITLKRFLSGVGRQLIFEQNTATTRNRFLSVAEPYMESIVQRQGLYSYKIVMDDSNNTPDVIDRNQLVGQIFVQPTKTAEFIILNFTVTPTGATF
jgi:hypothetical protein